MNGVRVSRSRVADSGKVQQIITDVASLERLRLTRR